MNFGQYIRPFAEPEVNQAKHQDTSSLAGTDVNQGKHQDTW
jgi:hypothetical protein